MYFESIGGYNMFIARVDLANSYGDISVHDDLESEIITLSVSNQSLYPGISVYPTLVEDIIYLNQVEEGSTLNIYSIGGKRVYCETIETSAVSLSDLPSGLYVLEILTDHTRFARKIVKR
jgi:hypothetical protein